MDHNPLETNDDEWVGVKLEYQFHGHDTERSETMYWRNSNKKWHHRQRDSWNNLRKHHQLVQWLGWTTGAWCDHHGWLLCGGQTMTEQRVGRQRERGCQIWSYLELHRWIWLHHCFIWKRVLGFLGYKVTSQIDMKEGERKRVFELLHKILYEMMMVINKCWRLLKSKPFWI